MPPSRRDNHHPEGTTRGNNSNSGSSSTDELLASMQQPQHHHVHHYPSLGPFTNNSSFHPSPSSSSSSSSPDPSFEEYHQLTRLLPQRLMAQQQQQQLLLQLNPQLQHAQQQGAGKRGGTAGQQQQRNVRVTRKASYGQDLKAGGAAAATAPPPPRDPGSQTPAAAAAASAHHDPLTSTATATTASVLTAASEHQQPQQQQQQQQQQQRSLPSPAAWRLGRLWGWMRSLVPRLRRDDAGPTYSAMKRDSDLDHLGPPRPPSFFSTESFLERWAFLSALVLIGFQSLGAVLLFPARFLRPVESWPNPLYAQDAALVPFLYHIHSTLSAVFFFALGPRLLYAAWRRSHSGARLSAAGSSQLNQRKTPFGSTVSALTRLPLPASDPAISLYWASLLVLVVSGVPAAVTETVYVVGVVVRDAAALLQTAPTHEIEGGWEAVPVGSVARGVLTVAAALLVAGICCAWRRWGESFANWVSAGCTRDRGSSRRTGRLWKRRSNPVMAGSPPSASSAVTSASSVQETPFGWLSSWQVSRRASDAGMDSAEGFTTGGVRHGRRSSVSFKAEAAASGYRGHWLASVLRFLVMGPHCSSQRSDDRPSSITRKVCESLHVYLAVHALLGATWAVFVAEEFPMDIRLALAPVDIGSLSSQDQSNSADSRSSALPHLATATVLSPYLTVWLVITAHIVTATALVYSSYQTALVPPQTQQLVTHKPRAPVNPPSSFQYHQYPPIGLSTQVITQPQFSATPVLCDFCAAAAAASPAIPSSSAASQLPHHTPRGTRTISAADRCRSFTQARTAVVAAHAAAVVAAAASSSSSTSSASSSLSSLSTLSSSASVDGDLDATGATGGPSCVRCGRPVAPSTLDEDPMPLPPPPPGGVPGIPTRRHNSGSPLGAAATASGMGVIEDDCDSARPTTSTAATMASGTPSLPSPSPSLMELGFVSPAAAKMVAAATHFAGATPPPSTSSFTVAAAAPLSGAASSRRHASWGTTHARIGLRMQGALVLVVGFVVTGMVVGWIFVCEASCGRGGGAGGFS